MTPRFALFLILSSLTTAQSAQAGGLDFPGWLSPDAPRIGKGRSVSVYDPKLKELAATNPANSAILQVPPADLLRAPTAGESPRVAKAQVEKFRRTRQENYWKNASGGQAVSIAR